MAHFCPWGGHSDPFSFIEEKDETLEKVSNPRKVGTDVGEAGPWTQAVGL